MGISQKKKGVKTLARFYIGKEELHLTDSRIVELEYYVTKSNIFYEHLNETQSAYGVGVEEKEKGQLTDKEEIQDITSNRDEIEKIIDVLKNNKVLPIHLKDVILDMLS